MSKGLFAGRYSIERVLGQGATATVHLARDTQRGIAVAIKLLRPELAQSKATDRFLKEIRRTSALQHPHILQVLDSGENDGRPYFVLPYMEGGTLRAKMRGGTQMTFDETIAILRTIAGALDHAHTKGLIHRDVKPENILFTNGEACLGDFGIARALETVYGTDGSTSSDTIRGTYAYMSPEQAAGARELDGRSDIYALACVAYEMITGMQAFIGPTPESVVAQRFQYTPREIRVYRPSAPTAIDTALAKAFAMSPADRYRTAGTFVLALEAALQAATGEQQRNARGTSPHYLRSRPVQAVSIVAMAGIVGAAWISLRPPNLDAGLYVVAPFAESGPSRSGLDGSFTATLTYEALRRWPDVSRVDPLRVNDFLNRRGNASNTLGEALAMARKLRAGRLLWGEIHGQASKTVVRGVLYDVENPDSPQREANVELAESDDSLAIRFAALVDTLVGSGQPRPPVGSSKPFAAVSAYAAGAAALNAWDLDSAQKGFLRAATAVPNYAVAHLRYAQVSQWLNRPATEWRSSALSAVNSAEELLPRERILASALSAMAERNYQLACQHYATLVRQDSLDFASWFGLGDCRNQDRIVVADAVSPSGWRYRSSRHAAAQSYMRAFELVPTSYRAYREMISMRLSDVLPTRVGWFLDGRATDPTKGAFAAFPELLADTIAFVPYFYADFTTGSRRPNGAAVAAALERGRQRLEDLAERWAATRPDHPDVWEIRADAFERAGLIRGHADRSAIGSITRARSFTADSTKTLQLAVSEIRLRLKAGQFGAARALSDSILSRFRDPPPSMAARLASLAGLVGRRVEMERLVERAAPVTAFPSLDGRRLEPAIPLRVLSLRLAVNAVLSGPRDTLDLLERTIESHLASVPDLSERAVLREAVLRNAAMFAFPVFGARPLHSTNGGAYLLAFQRNIVLGDTARVLHDLLALTDQRLAAGLPPGSVSVDAAYLEAAMLAQLGDPISAAARLDDVLENLSAQRDWFRDLHGPALLVTAMELRARLAERSGQASIARRWTVAVKELRRP